MTEDVLPDELMKQAKKVWEIHREYYGETDKEMTIDADDNAAVEAAEASLDELWLPVSAVTEWQKKIRKKLIERFPLENFCIVEADLDRFEKMVDEVLGVKP